VWNFNLPYDSYLHQFLLYYLTFDILSLAFDGGLYYLHFLFTEI
jgi:hypothetical protein